MLHVLMQTQAIPCVVVLSFVVAATIQSVGHPVVNGVDVVCAHVVLFPANIGANFAVVAFGTRHVVGLHVRSCAGPKRQKAFAFAPSAIVFGFHSAHAPCTFGTLWFLATFTVSRST